MCKYEMDPTSIVEDTERTRFCPQTDNVKPVYPKQLRCVCVCVCVCVWGGGGGGGGGGVPGDVYIRQSSWDRIMVCPLLGTKPLPESETTNQLHT